MPVWDEESAFTDCKLSAQDKRLLKDGWTACAGGGAFVTDL